MLVVFCLIDIGEANYVQPTLRGSSIDRKLQETISCQYTEFGPPIDVSEECCVAISSWVSAGADGSIDAICDNSDTCQSQARDIYEATPSFVPLVEPVCTGSEIVTVFVLSDNDTCGQTDLLFTNVIAPLEIGTCESNGYGILIPDSTFNIDGFDELIFDEYAKTPVLRLVHILNYYQNPGLCGQKRVPIEEVEYYTVELGYKLASCARDNFVEFIFPDATHDVFQLPPLQPAERSFDFILREWTVDFMRPTEDLGGMANRKSSASLLSSQRMRGMLINGMYPGPVINVYEDDTIVVDVENQLLGEGTAIHWHGIHQRGTPWSDGAELITQAPIRPMESYVYKFKADPPGTFFYHSHVRTQRSQGVQGPLIIQKRNDPFRSLYDEDRIVFISDQMREPDAICEGEEEVLASRFTGPGETGITACGLEEPPHAFNGVAGNGTAEYPYPKIEVEQGLCYRFRFILGTSDTQQLLMEITGHQMTIVSIDGADVEPLQVKSFTFPQASRVDAIICADNEPGDYIITGTYELGCPLVGPPLFASSTCSYQAVVHYSNYYGPPPSDPPPPRGPVTGTGGGSDTTSFTSQGPNASLITYEGIKMFSPHSSSGLGPVQQVPSHSIVLNVGIQAPGWTSPTNPQGSTWRWYFGPSNDVDANGKFKSHDRPSSPLLHTKGECGADRASIVDIPEDVEEFEIVVNNLQSSAHVIHLHGNYFRVINVGQYGFEEDPNQFFIPFSTGFGICQSLGSSLAFSDPSSPELGSGLYWGCPYNAATHSVSQDLDTPILRDTISLPRRSWVVLRVKNDNPGIWPFHCHVTHHAQTGLYTNINILPSSQLPIPSDVPSQGNQNCPVWACVDNCDINSGGSCCDGICIANKGNGKFSCKKKGRGEFKRGVVRQGKAQK